MSFLIKIYQTELILKSIIKNFINHQQILTKSKIDSIPNQKIFLMNSLKEAKNLKLLVGGERINSTELVENLLKSESIDIKQKMTILNTPQLFKSFFAHGTYDQSEVDMEFKKTVREPLSKNYLQAACFIQTLKRLLPHF